MNINILKEEITNINNTRKYGILAFHNTYEKLITVSRGSSNNHHNWIGGYVDHVLETFKIAKLLYSTMNSFRNLDFSLDSALIVLYFHDVEKIWMYTTQEDIDKDKFYVEELKKFDITFSEDELNALRYIHGEGKDYSSNKRVMGKLCAFCHAVDTISARIWFDKS
jgi:hypothetical protein